MTVNSLKIQIVFKATPDLFRTLRSMARSEGRPLQALIDEVLREYVTRKQGHAPRPNVMTVFYDSLRQYEDLYRKLAE